MNTTHSVVRDERTLAIENASYRWAYTLVCFALLIDVVYRGMFRNEAAWDLLALVVVSSSAATIHQIRHKIWAHSAWSAAVLIGLLAAAVAMLIGVVASIWFPSLFTK